MKQKLIDLGFRVGKNSERIHDSKFRSRLVTDIADNNNSDISNTLSLLFQSADIIVPDELLETESDDFNKDLCSFMGSSSHLALVMAT